MLSRERTYGMVTPYVSLSQEMMKAVCHLAPTTTTR